MNTLILSLLCLMVTEPLTSWAMDSSEVDQQEGLARGFDSPLRTEAVIANPGYHLLYPGDVYRIQSPNYPGQYPRSVSRRWKFKPRWGAMVRITCPTINISPSRRCRKDKLAIFPRRRRGVRRCGRINDFSGQWSTKVKVIFGSNWDNKRGSGFLCYVEGVVTTTTTTPEPGCQAMPGPNPILVQGCSDLDPVLTANCNCNQEVDQMFLQCSFCTLCDFNLFAAHQFLNDVVLEPHFNCSEPLDLTGIFHHNSASIVGLKICLEEDMSHINFPYSDLPRLTSLYYQDCNNTGNRSCLYEPNTGDNGPICSLEPILRQPLSMTSPVYPVNLPSNSDVPNLEQLFLADVNITLNQGNLPYSSLATLCANSHELEVVPNAFQHLTNIKEAYVELCQSDLLDDSFAIHSSRMDCLEIVDYCTHLIENHAVSLEQGCTNDTVVVSLTTEQDYIKYVPKCPFMTLLDTDCVTLNWNALTECRSCGNYWLWSLPTSRLDNVYNQCHDDLTDSVMPLEEYVKNNGLLPSCNFPIVQC